MHDWGPAPLFKSIKEKKAFDEVKRGSQQLCSDRRPPGRLELKVVTKSGQLDRRLSYHAPRVPSDFESDSASNTGVVGSRGRD